MKKCLKCGQCLPESEFPRDISRTDGLHPYCKACNRLRWRKAKGKGRSALEACTDSDLTGELRRRGFHCVPRGHPAYDRLFNLLLREFPELLDINQTSCP